MVSGKSIYEVKSQPQSVSLPDSKRRFSVLFVSPECAPFATSGGLGEVAGSLPQALKRRRKSSIDCRVIMPLYSSVDPKYRDRMDFIGTSSVPVSWRNQYMGLFKLKLHGVIYYFIDNEQYFNRKGLYGYYDDCERFAYFSMAVFKAIDLIDDFSPDIIHANDWQTALVPVYQNSLFRREYTKTVFTIHNIEYQGQYGNDVLEDLIGLPESENPILMFGEDVNLMKGGIESANACTTVSASYAEELQSPENAFGLDSIIRRNSHKIYGILNGIDTVKYNPERDPSIEANYSASDLSGKLLCKKALQRTLGLPEEDVPLITMVSRLVPAKGIDLVREIMDSMLSDNNVQFAILGTGYMEYEDYFKWLQAKHANKAAALIKFDPILSHLMYAGGDILLVPSRSEPCGITQMIGCRYANIPVVRATGGLKDSISDCTLGNGSGFVFENFDPGSLYAAIIRALNLYSSRQDWAKLCAYDMRLNFGWSNSAEEYRKIYEDLLSAKI